MRRSTTITGTGLALLALLLPARGMAAALVGVGHPLFPAVVQGAGWFRGALLLNGLLIVALGLIWLPSTTGQRTGPHASLLTRSIGPEHPVTSTQAWGLVGLLAVGTILRLYDLGNGLWFDEILTLVAYARAPLGEIVATFDSQNQHLLYSITSHLSIELFGESAWALRLPAVLFGVGSLAGLFWFGSLVTGRWEALLATAFLTFSYHHIWFSQNARGYTGLLLWGILASGFFLQLLESGSGRARWKPVVGYVSTAALALYTHATAAVILAAHGLIWLVLLSRRGRIRSPAAWMPAVAFLFTATLALQLYALVLPQFVETLTAPTMEGMATDWKNPIWFLAESVRQLARGIPGGLLALAAGALIGSIGLVSYLRRSPVITAVMIGPATLMVVTLVVLEHNLWPRLFFFSAGFALLIVVRGLVVATRAVLPESRRRWAPAAVGVLALATAATVPRAWGPKQDYLGALEYVERARGPADAVVVVDMSRLPYERYLREDWIAVEGARDLERVEGTHERTWVLYTFPTRLQAVEPRVYERLENLYETEATFPGTLGGGSIYLKVRG